MIYLQFISGLVLYSAMAFASYHPALKASPWFFPVGIGSAVVANFIWFSMAKADPVSSSLMIKGLIWDAVLMLCYLIIPIIFFEAKFTPVQAVGVGLTVIGLFLTKLA
jgi:drug/metabolite transporter (DMT)-like permease